MINIKSKFDCCGCEACSQVCTRHAITMVPDSQGFLYPQINTELCNNCGLCENVCPLQKTYESRRPKHAYAVKNKDEDVRNSSSSGGIFTILAENTIKAGGVVYGAVFDNDWNVKHERIDNIQDIAKLRGSKYVQSSMAGIYPMVKKDLQSGIPVLFSGCHCHIAALLSYLRKKYDNLTAVDVVCGGVPSPRIWRDYLNEEIAAHRAAVGGSSVSSSLNAMPLIKGVKFRDKSHGWRKYRFDLQLAEASADGKQSTVSTSYNTYIWEHTFMLSWLKGFISRPSCHKCHFREGRCGSEFTIGDYWCIERHYPEFSDDNGVSVLLAYDSDLPDYAIEKTTFIDTEFMHAANGQTCLLNSHPYNPVSKLYYYLHDHCGLTLGRTLKYCLLADRIFKKIKHYLYIVKAYLYAIKNKICRK